MKHLKIEKGIVILSKTRRYKNVLFDWGKINSGNSVFVKGLKAGTTRYSSLYQQAKRRDLRMVGRRLEGGMRLWFLDKEAKVE